MDDSMKDVKMTDLSQFIDDPEQVKQLNKRIATFFRMIDDYIYYGSALYNYDADQVAYSFMIDGTHKLIAARVGNIIHIQVVDMTKA